MRIAMFAPYFAPPGGSLPNYYEYWQKTAAANSQIDFFVPTNLNVSGCKAYDNIHYICMTAEEFWERLQTLLDFPISHAYYKTAEYRPFFGIIFKEYIENYDYWGSTEFDIIYGDITKFTERYTEAGKDIIGRYGPFRLIKNTDKLRNMPFFELKGFDYPLTLEKAFSTSYCWYFDEIYGMNIRYHQAGIEVIPLDDDIADINKKYKYLARVGHEGKWGFTWDDGRLIGWNDRAEEREFLMAHFQKRKLSMESDVPSERFSILPNGIFNGKFDHKDIKAITPGTLRYTAGYYLKTYKTMKKDKDEGVEDTRRILEEIRDYNDRFNLDPDMSNLSALSKIYSKAKSILLWK